jgi:hypothetical protein
VARSSPPLAAVVALLVGCLLGACTALQREPSPLVPGSQWRVVAVDGQTTAPTELILTFIGDSATLSTRCGAGVSEVTLEPEGPAVAFGTFAGPGEGAQCPAQMLEAHARVADALEGIERWQRSGAAIELHGDQVIRLEPQRTDT